VPINKPAQDTNQLDLIYLLQTDLPPPNPLPQKVECQVNDPPKISVVYSKKIKKKQKPKSISISKENSTPISAQPEILNEMDILKQRHEADVLAENELINTFINSTDMQQLYELEKKNLYKH
jgi:hypothetical protein